MGRSKRSKTETNNIRKIVISLIIVVITFLIGYVTTQYQDEIDKIFTSIYPMQLHTSNIDLNSIPEYNDTPYVELNGNIPYFTEEEKQRTDAFEEYSELDSLGRCGVAYANICRKLMPASGETRGEISSIYPSGWKNKPYKGMVEGDYLYNRCHLIGWQLAAENANEKNLITGTRYLNVQGMLPYENMVTTYLKERGNKNNHVLYRVTPIYEDKNLVPSGVEMEAYSVEDNRKRNLF